MGFTSITRLLLLSTVLLAACGTAQRPGQRWVKDIELRGTRSLPDSEILSGLATKKTGWWPFAKKRWYDRAVLGLDVHRIEAFYAIHGFFAAQVTKRKVERSEDGKSVDVELQVDEGKPTTFTKIELTGLPSDRALVQTNQDWLPIHEGDRFDHQRYLAAKSGLRARLRDAGYAYAESTGQVDVDREKGHATVRLQATPGPLVRFGETRLSGNGPIPADKVLGVVSWREGDVYDPELLELTHVRLANLRVFSSVVIELPTEPTPLANMRIETTPGKFHELRLGGGIGIESTRQEVRLRGEWIVYNFLGGLRTLRVQLLPALVAIPTAWKADSGGVALDSDIRLTQPYLFGTRFTGFAQLGYEMALEVGYRNHGPTLQLGVERPFWRDRLRLVLSWNMEFLDYYSVSEQASSELEDLFGTGFRDPYRPAWLAQAFTLDLRDARIDPRSGFYASLRLEQGFPQIGSDFSFIVATPEVRGYVPLGTKRVIVAMRALLGRLWALREGDSPITRRLELGGPNSHRGFGYQRLSPQVTDTDGQRINTGGNVSLLFSTDLRLRMFKLGGAWINFTAFVDGGDVVIELDELDFGNLHWATGGGLQYETPIGSLALAVGVRLNRVHEDPETTAPDPGRRMMFHLTIGDAF